MMKYNVPTSHKSCKLEAAKSKSRIRYVLLPILCLLSAALLIGSASVITGHKKRWLKWNASFQAMSSNICKTEERPQGTENLPKGIVSATSDLEMLPLCGPHHKNPTKSMNLLAIAVGIRQKVSVDKIVEKFPESDFVVMLFHYDGIVDKWKDLEWSPRTIHVSAINQTKWWFAKRFLHPDIVSEYEYIFLWDEDLGVEHFNARRYLSIIKEEGIEISQPALDLSSSEVHHELTKRQPGSRVHRRVYTKIGPKQCNENSSGPPCAGFVEMMAPVFSKASWRCAWLMIQNDLVHAWGLDFQLGHCSQGNRSKNIGIIDSEYIVHYGVPTLGGSSTSEGQSSSSENNTARPAVRKWSFTELEIFKKRWKKAVKNDHCWKDQTGQSQ